MPKESKLRLPADASKALTIRFYKDEYDFILNKYNSNPSYYRSFSGVVREGLNLLKSRKSLKTAVVSESLYN